MRFLSLGIVIALGATLGGCVVDASSSSGGSGGTGPAPSGSPTPTGTPPLLSIDTNRSLTATPGDGAGIFVTYESGGHWSLQWTCDTNFSSQSCGFDVSVSASAINAFNPVPQTSTVYVGPDTFRVRTLTAATLDGVTFETPPGAPIVLSATLNGTPTPSLVFYVGNHTLQTVPTDPVEFVPSDP